MVVDRLTRNDSRRAPHASAPRLFLTFAGLACFAPSPWCETARGQPAQATKIDNVAIIAETAAGKSADKLLVQIMAAPAENFDTSANGIRALKDGQVPDKIITAIVRQRNQDLTNDTLVVLGAADVSPKEIIRLIRETPPAKAKLDGSTLGLAALRGSGVDESIVLEVDKKKNPSLIDPDEDGPRLTALGARFSGGTVIGNGPLEITAATETAPAMIETDQFSQAATYLAFEMQPLWEFNSEAEGGWAFEPIANVRLTTIAVADPTFIEAPTEEFLTSQKAVQFQFGGVLGYHFKAFTLGTKRLRWTAGPMARYMPQSITDSQRTTRIWNLEDDLFEAWAVGGRLSLFDERSTDDDKFWRPFAYIDVSRGRFENYEQATRGATPAAEACLMAPSDCLSGGRPAESEYVLENHSRWYIESRLMLKYIYVGFDINTGPQGDDVRFIGGLTISLDHLYKKE